MLLLINATIQMAKIMCKNTKLNVYIFLLRLGFIREYGYVGWRSNHHWSKFRF